MDDRDLALLCALRAGLSAEALGPAADLDDDQIKRRLDVLQKAGHVASHGLFRKRWAISNGGQAALARWEEAATISLAAEGLRRVDPSLPFEANASWKEAICVNLAVSPEALRPLVPSVFELDLAADSAWVSLTVSRLADFGVGRLPRPLRMNFYQATYRAHVRYRNVDGELRRGCYFVRSDTSSPLMSQVANMLPEFRAHRCGTVPIVMARNGDHLLLTVDSLADPSGKVVLLLDENAAPDDRLQPGSRFRDLAEARSVIVDFHDAYAWEPTTSEVYVLSIRRGEWRLRVPRVVDAYLGYATDGPFAQGAARLDSVFTFRDVPYQWLPLVKEKVLAPPT
jgi:hypothetical protein